MIKRQSIKIDSILNDATTPNSLSNLLSVEMKVAKPDAVVTLVIKVALPIFVITFCRDRDLIPCLFSSC